MSGNYLGRVYCGAFSSGTKISSINDIKANSFEKDIQPKNSTLTSLTLTMTLKNLIPLQSYDIYCYSEDLLGHTSNFINAVNHRITKNTLCCRRIIFDQVPSFIYGNISLYLNNTLRDGFNHAANVFSYHLSSAPNTRLEVTPQVFYSNGTRAYNVFVLPPYAIFDSSTQSASLSSSFVLSSSNFEGVFLVSLSLSDVSADEFYVANATSVMLQIPAAYPAPSLLRAQFADSGSTVYIYLQSNIHLTTPKELVNTCDNYFFFRGSNSSFCTWMNTTTVSITFIAHSNLQLLLPGDILYIRQKPFQSLCKNCTDTSMQVRSIVVLYPTNPVKPTVVLKAYQLGQCADLTLDASLSLGSAGRPWKQISWTIVSSDGSDVAPIMLLLTSSTDILNPFEIDKSILTANYYLFTLTLENFLGISQSASAAFNVTDPIHGQAVAVTIFGEPHRVIRRSDEVSIFAMAILSHCFAPTKVTYEWKVYNETGDLLSMVSASVDPRRFLLKPYAVNIGKTYRVVVTAKTEKGYYDTAFVTLFVNSSSIFAAIKGGNYLSVSYRSPLLLDGSDTVDEGQPSGMSSLVFSWSCLMLTFENYGRSCPFVLKTNTSMLKIPSNTLELNQTYEFRVVATASDGRVGSAKLVVECSASSDTRALITSTFSKFVSSHTLVLDSSLYSTSSLEATWSIHTASGDSLSQSPLILTGPTRHFLAAQAFGTIQFPLSVAPGLFVAGSQYTFRITALSSDILSTVWCQTTLTTPSPPSSGILIVSPNSGVAFNTSFYVSTPYWATSADSLPLLYEYSYKLSPFGPAMIFKTATERAYIHTSFPAGLSSSSYAIVVTAKIMDIQDASSTVTTSVTVMTNINGSISALADFLSVSLSNAKYTADVDLAISTVNAIASTINSVDCIYAPNCSALNREACHDKDGTCGSCYPGYVGVVGSHNSMCHSPTATFLDLGSECSNVTEKNCIYGYCLDGKCEVPSKECAVNSNGDVCSGNGTCLYISTLDSSILEDCKVTSSSCIAQCTCQQNLVGESCELSKSDAYIRNEMSQTLCDALTEISSTQDPSYHLLSLLATSLQASLNIYDITDESTYKACSDVLLTIANLAETGYLTSAVSDGPNLIASTISAFVDSKYTTPDFYNFSMIESSLIGLENGVETEMVSGQRDVFVLSDNIQMRVSKALVSDLYNASLSAPETTADILYGTLKSKIILPATGLDACGYTNGYARFSVMQWGANPRADSSRVGGNYFRISIAHDSSVTSTASTPAETFPQPFEVVLQYDNTQNWMNIVPGFNTVTISSSRSCVCNVTSFGSTNITIWCEDVACLCPPRRVVSVYSEEHASRRLEYEFSSTDSSDYTTESKPTEFVPLIESFAAVLYARVGKNIHIESNVPALSVISCVSFVVILGFVFFRSWDQNDKHMLIYANNRNMSNVSTSTVPIAGSVRNLFKYSMQKSPGFRKLAGRLKRSTSSKSISESEKSFKKLGTSSQLISDFFENILPIKDGDHSFWHRMGSAMLKHHLWLSMFSYGSLQNTRTTRFIILCNNLLVLILIDSLVYEVMYSNSNCTVFSGVHGGTNTTCLSYKYLYCTCNWDEATQICSINPPPTNVEYFVFLTILIAFLSIVPQAFVIFVVKTILSRRPLLDDIGMSSIKWLGSHSNNGLFRSNRMSELGTAFAVNFGEKASVQSSRYIPNTAERESEKQRLAEVVALSKAYRYYDCMTVEEEFTALIQRVTSALTDQLEHSKIPWRYQGSVSLEEARLEAIQSQLGIYPDGTAMPLTWVQWIFFGTPKKRLEWKLRKVRAKAKEIAKRLHIFGSAESDVKDMMLIQYFIMEQISPFKRYALQKVGIELSYLNFIIF